MLKVAQTLIEGGDVDPGDCAKRLMGLSSIDLLPDLVVWFMRYTRLAADSHARSSSAIQHSDEVSV